MDEQKRNGGFKVALLVDEVNVHGAKFINFNGSLELRESVDLGFMLPPVVLLFPILGQPLNVGQGCAVVPACIVDFIGKGTDREFLV